MIVDLSVPLAHDHPSEPIKPQIAYEDHDATAPLLQMIFGCGAGDLPDGKGWASETVTLITHAGTHVDAPYHYFPTCGGTPARTIDELPLEWFIGPGVRLDVRSAGDGGVVGVSAVQAAVFEAGATLSAGDIVLLWTGAAEAWGTPEYPARGCGLDAAATHWLLDQGVRVIGTDAWGLDRPFPQVREAFERDGDPSVIWEAHRVGIGREYCQVEKLHNLDALPAATGFTVSCLPVKLAKASASWCRAVAIVP